MASSPPVGPRFRAWTSTPLSWLPGRIGHSMCDHRSGGGTALDPTRTLSADSVVSGRCVCAAMAPLAALPHLYSPEAPGCFLQNACGGADGVEVDPFGGGMR